MAAGRRSTVRSICGKSLLIDAGTFTDRVDGTGILTHRSALDLGIVGMAARASGVDGDFRRDHPHDAYEDLRFEVPLEEGGDVRARLMIRAREVEQSLSVLHQVLERLPESPLLAALPERLPAHSSALGWVEAWRGPCTHWVATDAAWASMANMLWAPCFWTPRRDMQRCSASMSTKAPRGARAFTIASANVAAVAA